MAADAVIRLICPVCGLDSAEVTSNGDSVSLVVRCVVCRVTFWLDRASALAALQSMSAISATAVRSNDRERCDACGSSLMVPGILQYQQPEEREVPADG